MCTGLEPVIAGLLGGGASAATVGALATGIGAAGAGMLGGQVLKSMQPKIPAAATAAPEKPPQATQAPARPAIQARNMAAARPGGAMAGNYSTFLTGPGGIDTGSLSLGRNTLLGQ